VRVLLVTWFFPPSNTIGAVRLGNLARFLLAQGHDLKVITSASPPYKQTLPIGFPEGVVHRAYWADVNRLPNAAAGLVKRALRSSGPPKPQAAPAPADVPAGPADRKRGAMQRLADVVNAIYVNLFNWPDAWVGWLPFAVRSGRRLSRSWTPGIVFASGPPFTTLLIGYLLSRIAQAPLVLEFRDRWWDDPYYPPPAWRRRLNRAVERRLAGRARAIVTVSEPWAETYRQVYGKPTQVVYNGYDDALAGRVASECPAARPGPLRIVYTGGIYPGRRDPTPLFEAVRSLGERAGDVRIEFYGSDPELVLPLARNAGVADSVVVLPEVTHDEAVAIQQSADVLLLLQWNDPREQGNVPGKFFEYLGARRPILVLGLQDGVPASIVQARGAGHYGGSAEEIAALLQAWLSRKRSEAGIPLVDESARAGFSRFEQFRELERFLESLIDCDAEGSRR